MPSTQPPTTPIAEKVLRTARYYHQSSKTKANTRRAPLGGQPGGGGLNGITLNKLVQGGFDLEFHHSENGEIVGSIITYSSSSSS